MSTALFPSKLPAPYTQPDFMGLRVMAGLGEGFREGDLLVVKRGQEPASPADWALLSAGGLDLALAQLEREDESHTLARLAGGARLRLNGQGWRVEGVVVGVLRRLA